MCCPDDIYILLPHLVLWKLHQMCMYHPCCKGSQICTCTRNRMDPIDAQIVCYIHAVFNPLDLFESDIMLYPSHFIEAQPGIRMLFGKVNAKAAKHQLWELHTQLWELQTQLITVCAASRILCLQRCSLEPGANEIFLDAHQEANKAILEKINLSQNLQLVLENWIKHNEQKKGMVKARQTVLNLTHKKNMAETRQTVLNFCVETFSQDHNFWHVCYYFCDWFSLRKFRAFNLRDIPPC